MASISKTKHSRANLRPFLTPFTKPHTPRPLHYWLTLNSLHSLWGYLNTDTKSVPNQTPNFRCWHQFGISWFQSQHWYQINTNNRKLVAGLIQTFWCWHWFGLGKLKFHTDTKSVSNQHQISGVGTDHFLAPVNSSGIGSDLAPHSLWAVHCNIMYGLHLEPI